MGDSTGKLSIGKTYPTTDIAFAELGMGEPAITCATPEALKMISYADIEKAFETDGSWRDLYAFETTEDHWRSFLTTVLQSNWPAQLIVNDRPVNQPDVAVKTLRDLESHASLSIDVCGAELKSYFFTDDQIELDLVPAEINETNFPSLLEFIALMARSTGRNVFVTEENSPSRGIFVYNLEAGSASLITRTSESTELSRSVGQSLHLFASQLRRCRRHASAIENADGRNAITTSTFELSESDAIAAVNEWKTGAIFRPNQIQWHTQLTEGEFLTLNELDVGFSYMSISDVDLLTEILGASPMPLHFWARLELACRAFGIPTRED
ncbi:MAG TPA: hypothetical protein PKN33_02705 [Phycisphaerae bacterium]|nr:hypothetical protein [Phycisphaerae bacterium]